MRNYEETTKRIRHIGKIVSILCRIAMVASLFSAAVHAFLIVRVCIDESFASSIDIFYLDNSLHKLIVRIASFDGFSQVHRSVLGCIVILIYQLTVFVICWTLLRLLHYLSEGGRPFDKKVVKMLRKIACVMLLWGMYNIRMGIFSFALVILFSYILEYGGYIQERADETNRIQEEIILSFAEITENKSGQTGMHIKRVSEYSKVIADQMGLPHDEAECIRIASMMHDIGKLLTPTEILEKPGKLTNEEFEEIKKHTTYGGQLLENVEGSEMQMSRTIALQHHERYDGHGYPAALSGQDISIEGRIVAVADVYDALTSRRSYKNAWTEEDAYNEILKGKGTQFDPAVVDAFSAAHDEILKVYEEFREK